MQFKMKNPIQKTIKILDVLSLCIENGLLQIFPFTQKKNELRPKSDSFNSRHIPEWKFS